MLLNDGIMPRGVAAKVNIERAVFGEQFVHHALMAGQNELFVHIRRQKRDAVVRHEPAVEFLRHAPRFAEGFHAGDNRHRQKIEEPPDIFRLFVNEHANLRGAEKFARQGKRAVARQPRRPNIRYAAAVDFVILRVFFEFFVMLPPRGVYAGKRFGNAAVEQNVFIVLRDERAGIRHVVFGKNKFRAHPLRFGEILEIGINAQRRTRSHNVEIGRVHVAKVNEFRKNFEHQSGIAGKFFIGNARFVVTLIEQKKARIEPRVHPHSVGFACGGFCFEFPDERVVFFVIERGGKRREIFPVGRAKVFHFSSLRKIQKHFIIFRGVLQWKIPTQTFKIMICNLSEKYRKTPPNDLPKNRFSCTMKT